MHAQAVGDQGRADHQQEAQRQHDDGRIVADEARQRIGRDQHQADRDHTAATMIGMSSVMPTAVMMQSIEKTRSSSRIWHDGGASKADDRGGLPVDTSPCSAWATLWWISVVAFQTRNRPPAIRIRSRHEKPWPNRREHRLGELDDEGDAWPAAPAA